MSVHESNTASPLESPARNLDDSGALALAETVPGERQTPLFWISFAVAWGATGIAQGVAGVAVPQLLKQWDAASASANLSGLLTIGGLATLVVTPIFGRLSDRSRSRLGLRRPWILLGSLIAFAGYLALAFAPSAAWLWIGIVLNYVGWGAVAMAQHSLFADQIRRRIRAIMSAVTGAAATVGILVGTMVTGQIASAGQAAMFLIPGTVAVVLSLTLFATLRDLRRTDPPAPFDLQSFIGTFWLSPRQCPDFAWAWICRFLMTASIVTVTSYLYLTISGRFDVDDPATISGLQTQATLAFTVCNLAFAFIFGVISDRTRRRKPSVLFGALLSAVGLIVAVSTPGVPIFLVGIALVGAGQGAYISADVALMTECLPSVSEAGKDLGIVALAYLLPNILVPALGFLLTRIGSPNGENFVALYVAAFVMAVFAGFSVLKIKSVR
ncbi:MFS transporter [Arthrobacter sp. NPDC090010]|uniref:MFS transporter n=1 Tax=Arthrobacter sp. NPDC090010 TaxID=3363942 RepID=UPI0037F80C44